MAKRRRKKIFGLFGRAKGRKQHIPAECKTGLSHCMKGGGKRKAGPCMRAFWACRRAA